MYKAKAVMNRGFKVPRYTATCPVCRHDVPVHHDQHSVATCRCGAVIELDHGESSVIVMAGETETEPESGEDATSNEDAN